MMDETIGSDLVFSDKEYKNEIGIVYAKSKSLTKREYFAAMAMQGLLANPELTEDYVLIAKDAVQMADALINALNETK